MVFELSNESLVKKIGIVVAKNGPCKAQPDRESRGSRKFVAIQGPRHRRRRAQGPSTDTSVAKIALALGTLLKSDIER